MAAGTGEKQPRTLKLRYAATCVQCGIALSPGTEALWDPGAKTVTCLACAPGGEIEHSEPGASAAAEGTRRADRKVEQVRRRYGDHAAIVAEAMAAEENERSWAKGAAGESRLAAYIEREVGDHVIPLHDRLIPGTRTNVDHIFVAPTGIWVVDAKAYTGKVEHRERGPLWSREHQVWVGGSNRTKLTGGVEKQRAAVVAAVRSDDALKDVTIYAALCFLDSDWGFLGSPFTVGKVWVAFPGALRKELRKKGEYSRDVMEQVARRIDLSLPPAAKR